MAKAKKQFGRGRKQGRGWTGLRGALRGEQDREVGFPGEEGGQEGRQQPQARRASDRT